MEYIEAKKHYENANSLLESMQQRLMEEKVDIEMPALRVIVHERATASPTPTESENQPASDTYLAVGGTVFDGPGTLTNPTAFEDDNERTNGVGFRFVMADE